MRTKNANISIRRLLALIIALIMAGMLCAGCTQGAADATPTPAATTEAVAPTDAPDTATPSDTPTPSEPAAASRRDSAEVMAAYLAQYFDVSFSGTVTEGALLDALTKVQPEAFPAAPEATGSELTALSAVKYTVEAANMGELALVYTDEKTAAVLSDAGVSITDGEYAPYIACAIDLSMITAEEAQAVVAGGSVDAALANALVMAVADINGTSRHYLGYSDDPDIYAMFINAWERFEIFDDETLSSVGAEAVINGVTTGYNLCNTYYNARFLTELTIRYGHSDIKHAIQLLGLLESEGIVARVQFEPKVSIYKHMPEWGEADMTPTRTSQAREFEDGLILIYATEYDMALEFQSEGEMLRFNDLILDYAKKNSGEEGKALLYGSWWQPLYYTHFDIGEGYHRIIDNVITNGDYTLHPFCLEENMEQVKAAFLAINPDLDIEQVPIWCDAPFYRYLNGEAE